jgi:hypothetical protein
MDPDSPPATAAAREAFHRLSGRSPLLGWMRQNHALITDRMNTVRPSWDDIADVLARLGVRDANGAAPKTEAVRRAYHRVTGALNAKGLRRRRSKAQIAADRAEASPAPALPPPHAAAAEPPAPSIRPAFDPTEGAFDPQPPSRFKFKPASLK